MIFPHQKPSPPQNPIQTIADELSDLNSNVERISDAIIEFQDTVKELIDLLKKGEKDEKKD